MSELSKGWSEISLDKILDSYESGSRPKGGVRGISDGIPSIGGEHLSYSGGFDFSNIKYVPIEFAKRMSKGKIHKNDILIVKDGATTGKTAFVDKEFPFDFAVANEHVFVCRVNEMNFSKYVFHYLYSYEGQQRILENFQGSAQGGINKSFASGTTIPLPQTLNEQHRIVERLELLLDKINKANERLEKIPSLLMRFRQSVLSSACSGKLTADWNEKNKCGEWENVSSSEIFQYVTSGSRGWAEYYSDTGAIFIRIGNLNRNSIKLDFEKIQYVNPPLVGEGTRTKVKKNDILISITADLGMVALVDDDSLNAYINQHVALARPKTNINARYLAWILASKDIFQQLTEKQRGATKIGLGLQDIKTLNIPIPSLPEQGEIVQRVDKLFTLADKVEQRYKNAKDQLVRAEKAIYAKAFRGELVKQEVDEKLKFMGVKQFW